MTISTVSVLRSRQDVPFDPSKLAPLRPSTMALTDDAVPFILKFPLAVSAVPQCFRIRTRQRTCEPFCMICMLWKRECCQSDDDGWFHILGVIIPTLTVRWDSSCRRPRIG